MSKIKYFILSFIIFLAVQDHVAFASGYWELQETTATTSIVFQKGAVTLLINYNPRNYCRPEFALIIFSDRSLVLGNFIKRNKTNDNMSISIDGKIFYGKIIMTKYTNAMEVGFGINEQAVSQFKNGKNALVKVYDRQFQIPIEGSTKFIETAQKNCR